MALKRRPARAYLAVWKPQPHSPRRKRAASSRATSCALWSSLGANGEPLDDAFGVADIAPESLEAARREIVDFLDLVGREIGETWREFWELESFGHDFWLTRNGHGAGFWDRYGFSNQPGRGLGNTLSKLARSAGSSDAYVGDDGRVYLT